MKNTKTIVKEFDITKSDFLKLKKAEEKIGLKIKKKMAKLRKTFESKMADLQIKYENLKTLN